jgi:methyl-accepting chemotaxis protein
MTMKNLKIGTRLTLAFGLVLLITLITALLTLSKIADIQDNLRDIVQDNNVKIRLSNEMSEATHIIARVMRTVVLLKDKGLKEQRLKTIAAARESYGKLLAELEKMPASEADKTLRKKNAEVRAFAGALNNKVIELSLADKETEAVALLVNEAGPATQKVLEGLNENIALQQAETAVVYANAEAQYQTARLLLITANALVVLLAAL